MVFKPLLHLGAHYHLTNFYTITLQTTAGTTLCTSLTPLSILHMPCNSSFEDQESDLGKRPPTMEFSLPVFQTLNFSYITTSSQSHPHYHLTIKLYRTWIPLFTTPWPTYSTASWHSPPYQKVKPAHTSTLNDVLTYSALSLALIQSVLFIAFFCSRRHCFLPTAPPESTPIDSAHTPLQYQVRCSHS